MKNQLEEYKGMSTDVPGQTLGDTIAGIVFTKNSAYSVANSKGTVNEAENEVEELHRKCRLLETQNKSIEEKIVDINEDYKMLKSEIEKIKRIKRQGLWSLEIGKWFLLFLRNFLFFILNFKITWIIKLFLIYFLIL